MICNGCLVEYPDSEFPLRADRSGIRRPYCGDCRRNISRARYAAYKRNSPFKLRSLRLKSAAQFKKVPYDLDADYLESIWTGKCPVFGMDIHINEWSKDDEYAAEADRIVPSKGYVKGNIAFLSRRANRLKNNVTSTELKMLYDWLKGQEDAR